MLQDYKVGDIVSVTITGVQPYGAFASLPNNTSGLIHISEISNEFVRNVEQFVSVEDVIDVKIIDIDTKTKQAKLSLKALDTTRKRKEKRLLYKSNKQLIAETPKGFTSLKEMLPDWIENYKMK